MSNFQFISKNEQSTKDFARALASQLKNKDIIVLTGNLGSGKTKFTEGILTYFGLENEISSPTFTIVNEYKKDDTNIYHFDVYRLEDSSEFYEIGGEEYFETGICIIEWGELIEDALPKDHLHITFDKDETDENIRILNNFEKINNDEIMKNIYKAIKQHYSYGDFFRKINFEIKKNKIVKMFLYKVLDNIIEDIKKNTNRELVFKELVSIII